VPAGLTSFYSQPLTWGSCTSYAMTPDDSTLYANPSFQCARLTVPLDYASPTGATASIGVLRVKATDAARRIGSVVVNPGGPGASGMEAAANTNKNWSTSPLAARFDLVGFDPRGIGASQPAVHCLTASEYDAERASDLDDDVTPDGVAKFEAQQRQYANDCAQRTQHGTQMLGNVGTRDVARDMDVLRSALGEPKLTYLGYSYGTYLGTIYAEQFPRNVRALLLDGAVDPTESLVDETVGQATGFQTAFNQYVQSCVKQPDCPLGTDPAQAVAMFRDLVNPLLTHPVPVGDGRMLGYDDATIGAIQALYSPDYWQYLTSGLTELKQNSGHILMTLADAYDGRNADGSYNNEQDAFNAVQCVDAPPVSDVNTLAEASARYKQAAPFLDDGRPAVGALSACDYWPAPPTERPHLPSVTGLPPTLVISTTNDPATPYQNGVKLANALHGGLLTFQGTQHTTFLQGNSCIDQLASNYLINLTLPPTGAKC
jgi:pimeloyl-ACP methyl ester carboxylesterase